MVFHEDGESIDNHCIHVNSSLNISIQQLKLIGLFLALVFVVTYIEYFQWISIHETLLKVVQYGVI